MQTIAFVSRKGGTGKSTLAVGLGVAAMEAGHKVCLLETDPLGGVELASPPALAGTLGGEHSRRICSLSPRASACSARHYIDDHRYRRRLERRQRGRHVGADLYLIPTRPSPADIDAAAPTLAAVRESGKPFAVILNQVQARTTRLTGAAGSLSKRALELNMSQVLALPAIVPRDDQQDALGAGLGVTEYAPRGKSAEEIRALWLWIRARLSCGPVPEMEATAHKNAPMSAAITVRAAPAAVAAAG
jgi:chromosome partitioning protein